ncbi:hypothetical protein G7Z17_g6998 [Cylindrodendrum hubeiense]|uniref:Uncharacterized protein n=1 Tax=Cylindrodendrum hubeiense TaxID=595255 RepID=A0A9P5LEM1_9HYPO|nr:hypothetical protein G7Z17_g6998 [Cylindrodendrum hubeiense]
MRPRIENPESIVYITPPPPDPSDIFIADLAVLDHEHKEIFRKALARILSAPTAEHTYAQILDGLPTKESFHDSYVWMRRHPVYELEHTEVCEGFLDKARDFRAKFDPSELLFKQSCNAMWIHGSNSDLDHEVQCPLPIHGTPMNRPRWDADDAMTRFHIFRDKYERKVPINPPPPRCVRSSNDWPELDDYHIVGLAIGSRQWGQPVDEEAVAAAEARLKDITPSSPLWKPRLEDSN